MQNSQNNKAEYHKPIPFYKDVNEKTPKTSEFNDFLDKIFAITVKGLKPATSCVEDQDATTVPVRHM